MLGSCTKRYISRIVACVKGEEVGRHESQRRREERVKERMKQRTCLNTGVSESVVFVVGIE